MAKKTSNLTMIPRETAKSRPAKAAKKAKRNPPRIMPIVLVGGIDPDKAYELHEFLTIVRMSRQTLSRIRRQPNGLIVRDAGVPVVLGSDWIDYCKRQPAKVEKRRRPPRNPETGEFQ